MAARRTTGLWMVLMGGALGTALSFLMTVGAAAAWAGTAAWALVLVSALSIAVFYARGASRREPANVLDRHVEWQRQTAAPRVATRPPRGQR